MDKVEQDIYILGIESSCDETAAAVVKNGREVLSNIISSQIVIHRKFGGVVPEIASRKHIEHIIPVIHEALKRAGVTLEQIDGIAVTYGPGLVGALLVGLAAAKALAWALDKPEFFSISTVSVSIAHNFVFKLFSATHWHKEI